VSAAKELHYDPDVAIRHLSDADPVLGKLIDTVGPFGLEVRHLRDPYHALLRSIVYQQLSGKAAATIYGRVVGMLDGDPPTPDSILAAEDQSLRDQGLSWAKIRAVKDLASHMKQGTIPTLRKLKALDNEAIIERLTVVRGIGRWSVEMLLMFSLGRADVLPVTDLGVRKGYMLTYGLDEMPTPKELEQLCEHWRPYRSVASWYMWRALDSVA